MSESPNFESNAFGRKRKFKGNKSWKKADDKKGQSDGTVTVKKVAEEDGPSQEKRSKQDAAAGDSEKRQSAPVSQVLRGINVLSFAEARAVEIQDTMEALKEATTVEGKRVFQKLPRHMRRRAASFNRRRLPRRMHQKAIKEEEKVTPAKKTKMPSRKHRRRPKNLLEEYNRRKMNHAWLETHIWHAKRFKMVERFGYKLADKPCDKGFRSTYRASAHGCIMQDISYHGCIEISGSQEDILQGLKHHYSKETGSKIETQGILSGKAASNLILYHYDSYPSKAIGPVSIIWKPTKNDFEQSESLTRINKADEVKDDKSVSNLTCGSVKRTVWIWCHPLCHDELVDAFKETYRSITNIEKDLTYCSGTDNDIDVSMVKEESGIQQNDSTQVASSTKPQIPKDESMDGEKSETDKKPKISSEKFSIGDRILIHSRKLDFFKIRLTGPFSHKILFNALQLHEPIDCTEETWWKKYYDRNESYDALVASNKAWKILESVNSPAEVPPHAVLGLTVVDPRLNIPLQKTWPVKEMKERQQSTVDTSEERLKLLTDWPAQLSNSPIWSEDIRKEVTTTKISEAELNKKRSEKLDLGKCLGIDESSSRIPIMLIQRPGVEEANQNFSTSHYGSGYDVIIPGGWGMAFWVSLVYRGAHVGGQREERNIHLEMKAPHFPREFPDSNAGKKKLEEETRQNEAQYNRYPPNKRPNYQKLGIEEPFGCSWQNTVDQWSRVVLDVIKSLDEIPVTEKPKKLSISEEDVQASVTPNAFFAKVTSVNKENIGDFYVLRDRQLLRTIKDLCLDYKLHGSKKTSIASVDVSEKRLELLTFLLESHSKAIIPISFQCVRRGEITDNALISIPLAEDIRNLNSDVEYGGPLEPAHRGLKASFPAIADTVKINRNHVKNIGLCTRWTIGRVTSGRYSLSCGKSAGIGFVSIAGLVLLFLMHNSDEDRSLMLVRNMSSKQYRFARMDLIMP